MSRLTSAMTWLAAAALTVAAVPTVVSAADAPNGYLRVCADPNNLPYSNDRGEGFENKLAEMLAHDLGKDVVYTWHAERRGFIRETLNSFKCDVVMGIPALDMLWTTRPYYRSTYVFVSRMADNLTFSSIDAPELEHLKIGVHLIGDDGANTPPAEVLGERHIVDNVVGYPIYGDYRQDSPPSKLIKDVENGTIDIAAAWGPLAGYYAKKSPVPLRIVPITDTMSYLPLVFQYSISMGVRRGDETMRDKLNEFIISHRDEIDGLLDSYGVPRS
ncbi:MAG TPA: substrate-binding domain-containing protein [Reyranella sp.]|nr:substrate-binding domain-containing protein [Reyranella sp.]